MPNCKAEPFLEMHTLYTYYLISSLLHRFELYQNSVILFHYFEEKKTFENPNFKIPTSINSKSDIAV